MEFFLLVLVPVFGAIITLKEGHAGIALFMILAATLNFFFVVGNDDSGSGRIGECQIEWDGRGNPTVCY